ncbi:MAG: LemA family protein [Nanobdellota archaeon]
MKTIKQQPKVKPWWVILGILVLLVLITWGSFNGLVSREENVDRAWANVESDYQRRADLIPNLVSTVKGYTQQEKDVLQSVTEARTSWQNAGSQEAKMSAANEMDGALSRLLVTVEAYPDLKSSENFLSLQDELAGTENRISVSRKRYNEAVMNYNKKVRRFPSNIIASMFGFEKEDMFEAEEGADQAPDVEF